MQRELRLYDPSEPEPAEPIRPRLYVPRLEPHYSIVVLPLSLADDPEEVRTFAKSWDAIEAGRALAADPAMIAKLAPGVRRPTWIAVIDAYDWEAGRWEIKTPPVSRVSWWWNLLRRWW